MSTLGTQPAKKPYNWRNSEKNDPIYVLNASAGNGRESGIVQFHVQQGNEQRGVIVQNTHIPQDLTEQVLTTQILDSIEFRQLVSKGILIVMEPGEAQRELATPAAQAEVSRMKDVMARGHAVTNKADPTAKPAAAFDVKDESKDVAINMNVGIEILDRHARGEITTEAAAEMMRGIGPLLKADEKMRLRQMQDIPQALREAIAVMSA